jgi:hypothetical protein
MIRFSDAISGVSPLGAGSLLQLLRGTKGDLMDGKGLGDIADVGAAIATGSFIRGVVKLRLQVWESPLSKAVRPTLVLCPPSLFHLFGDDARIKEALAAERGRPYQACSFRSKPAFQPRLIKSKSWSAK